MVSAVAFAPGHISGFFQPVYDKKNIYKTGSRGAGFSVVLGAISHVSIEQADYQKIVTYLNGKLIDSTLTNYCLHHLVGDIKRNIIVKTRLELPLSQGFGMSAASALSIAYAAATCLKIPLEDAVKAAHAAELKLKTGLGDVIGSLKGGFEIRSIPGLPPYGAIKNMYKSQDIVLCVVGKGLATKNILLDKEKQKTIDGLGGFCTDELIRSPSIEHFFTLSEHFARKTGLATEYVIQAIDAAKTYGLASMCMLGTAVFAAGNTKKLVEALKEFGEVIVTTIDLKGVRVLSA